MSGEVSPAGQVVSSRRLVVLAPKAPELGARVRDILVGQGGYAVSLVREANAPADLIIPIFPSGLDPRVVLTDLRASLPDVPILAVLDESHVSHALDRALPRLTDFLVGPVRGPELLARVQRLFSAEIRDEEVDRVRERLHESMALDRLRGADPAFQAVKQRILRAAKTDVTVLVTGETGTGKELTAQAIHYLSGRAGKPFVPVDCGAIPSELFENELFGHCRGAYTDARTHQRGLIAEAEGGTLFLDEVDALPPTVQVKLLRFLEDRSYRPLGSSRRFRADVRVVAATNTDLGAKVRESRFRADLFYRLNVVSLRLPPLRERVGDIRLLAACFLDRHAAGDDRWRFAPDALEALCNYDWPGNVRELENLVWHLVVMNPPKLIRSEDLPWSIRPPQPIRDGPADSFRAAKAQAIARFEQSYLTALLQTHRGNISRAAHAARQDRRTFRRLIQKHRLDPSSWTNGQ